MLDTSKITTEQYILGAIAGFLVLFAIGTCGGGGGAKDPQTLAHKLVRAIAQKDRAAADKLMISEAKFRDLVKASTMPDEAKEEVYEGLDKGEVDTQAAMDLRWESLYSRMSLEGFDHTQMKVVDVDSKEEERQGMTGSDVKVEVESAGKSAHIQFAAIKSKLWYLLPRIDFRSNSGTPTH
jgi:hypothetical protein